MDCIFCKIANHELSSNIVAENDYAIAFEDLSPVAPVHVLVVPKIHISNIMELSDENLPYVIEIHKMIQEVAKIKGVDESGKVMQISTSKDLINWSEPEIVYNNGKVFGNHYNAIVPDDDKNQPNILADNKFSILNNHNGTNVMRYPVELIKK